MKNKINYDELYNRAGRKIGWDFSKIEKRIKSFGKKWDFTEVVKSYVDKDTTLLDIGTGGGEKLLKIANFVKQAYGIDSSQAMIDTACKNLARSSKSNIEFKLADAKRIPYPANFFDIVICRHAPFYPKEIKRVLKSGGVFISQQVGEADKQNIKAIFGRGQSFGQPKDGYMRQCLKELEAEGLKIVRFDVYDATEYYFNTGNLIFLLKNTPIIPDFDLEKDKNYLKQIEKKYRTKNGIKTNSSRFMIIATK